MMCHWIGWVFIGASGVVGIGLYYMHMFFVGAFRTICVRFGYIHAGLGFIGCTRP